MMYQLNLLDDEVFREQPDTNETTDDLDDVSLQVISQTALASTDWTTETIVNQMNKGNILLNPTLQRRDAWEASRKSKFIESLLVGLPVPQLVLAESRLRKGSYIVIDGKQRLLSLRQFTASDHDTVYKQLRLTDLDIRKDLIGKTFEDIKKDLNLFKDVSTFENQPIRTVVIRNWRDENLLYRIFLRLNTGSIPLSPQELRQALHPGQFVDFADTKSAESPSLQEILKTRKPDSRMRDTELFVRYYAFRNFLPFYSGNLKNFLDYTCQKLNEQWREREEEILQQANDFEAAYQTTREIFGPQNVFRKWIGHSYQRRFSRAIFDIMIFSFSQMPNQEYLLNKREDVELTFKDLCVQDNRFLAAIEQTTKSLEATCNRLAIWAEALNQRVGTDLYVPTIVDNRIVIV